MSVSQDLITKSSETARPSTLKRIYSTSSRSFTISTILVFTMISAVFFLILAEYRAMDVTASMLFLPIDCGPEPEWVVEIGHHCFSDYRLTMTQAMQLDPWLADIPANYPATGLLVFWLFGHIARSFGDRVGLLGYLFCLTAAVLSPAIWSARASLGREKIVVFFVCSAAAIPAWTVIDRGNSVGFAVPIMLAYLISLRREQWKIVAVMVVLATIIKPQFALLGVALFSHRQWRIALQAGVAIATTNILAYLLWPAHFPQTITRTIREMLKYGSSPTGILAWTPLNRYNVSFIKGIFLISDAIEAKKTNGVIAGDYLQDARTYASFGIVLAIIAALTLAGRRIPPVMIGVTLLATASLYPPLSGRYYLLFSIPIAAMILRDPQGPPSTGTFENGSKYHRLAVFLISFSTAATIAQIPLPISVAVKAFTEDNRIYQLPGAGPLFVESTAIATPLLWLATCLTILVSYARNRSDVPGCEQ